MDATEKRPEALAAVVLALLVAVGAYLRLANVGELGFRWDEDLSSLAVRAILEKGIPELPSGMVYLRGVASLYMMAASAELLGFSEFALRLPSVVFGVAMIPLAFLFGRALFDARTGLVVAALITFSVWDIEFSRYARMYAPFGFFYVLTVLCLWKYRVQSERRAGGALCVVLAMLAISLHQLGYTLVPAFFFPLIIKGPSAWRKPSSWAYPIVAGGLVAVFFFVSSGMVSHYRELPRAASAPSAQNDAESPPAAAPAAPLEAGSEDAGSEDAGSEDAGSEEAGSEEAASSSSGLLAELPLLEELLGSAPLVFGMLVAGLLAAAVLFASRRSTASLDRIVLILIAACCAVQLFNFALLGLFALAFLKREGLPAFRRPDVLFAIAVIGVSFVAWVAWVASSGALGLVPEGSAGAAGLRGTIRSLLDYPHFFSFWGYPNEWPLASLVAAVGCAWAFDRASRPAATAAAWGSEHLAPDRSQAAACFLLLALGTPLILNGLFETAFQLFRYNVPLNTFYFTFVALALTRWREVVAAWRGSSGGVELDRRLAASAGAALVLLVVSFDLNPLRGWLVTQRHYLNDGALYRAFDMVRYADFKTPAEFVKSSASADDTIIALDSREYFNYLGRLDYWVRTGVYDTQTYERNGKLRDQYVGTPLIMSLEELHDVLEAPGRTKWLIASDSMLAGTRAVTEEIKEFIRGQDEHVVYVGRDGDTKVYRFGSLRQPVLDGR